jgi:regulation of enolase protein 1 (concanavalin A-like superfamily)
VLIPSSDVPFREDFDQGLSPGWFWLGEDPGRWSLTERPGFLRILLDPAGCRSAPTNAPLRPEPVGDYTVETLVEFTPVSNFQLAGLIVFQDDENYLKLGRAFCEGGSACIGNGVYFDSYFAGSFADANFATSTYNPSHIYLRLQRSGDVFTASYSEDGQNWGEIGQHSSALQPQGVGLFAGQSCSGSIPADFDYFSINPLK